MVRPEDVQAICSRETLEDFLYLKLGYRDGRTHYEPHQLDIPPKPSELIRSTWLLSSYEPEAQPSQACLSPEYAEMVRPRAQQGFQIYLFEVNSLTRTAYR